MVPVGGEGPPAQAPVGAEEGTFEMPSRPAGLTALKREQAVEPATTGTRHRAVVGTLQVH